MTYDSISVQSHSQLTAIVRRTTQNIKGWYFYCFSSEPFAVSAVATYIPLLLEQFARLNGVQVVDHTLPCLPTDDKCVVPLFHERLFIDTSSFPLYIFSISVLFELLIVVTVSGIVDLRDCINLKKWVLMIFGFIGSFSTIWISHLKKEQFYSLPILYIIANACFGVINVVGNSLLPRFVTDSVKYNPNTDRNTHDPRKDNVDHLTTLISGRGASLGYSSALLVQIISMFLVKRVNSLHIKQDDTIGIPNTIKDIQVPIWFVGIWWFLWQLPMIKLMSDLPSSTSTTSPSLLNQRLDDIHSHKSLEKKPVSIFYGWLSLWEAFKHARLLEDVMIFLIGWFIISDSITTINSTAILFSRTELQMTTLELIIVSILTMISAMIGAFIIPQFLSKRFHWSTHKTLLFIICWATFIPFYGMLGFVFNSFGLKKKFEMFLLAMWYGISLGGLSAVSRSLFSQIIPRGKESTFFSIFSITDKGSSIVGPFLIGLVTDKTHNIRYAFYVLFALLLISLPVMNCLNVERGRREAQELNRVDPNLTPEEADEDSTPIDS
ncbi:hypothetical protein NCAS_0B08900 [Naumovozyma castellii]|uniref:Autophagy-related protein n=1 Tax=Naumovozyma castellii TaxID=27288 RepID=G0VAU7_NAUCA|nr:hypothetical protein NCAS_0B08900 [Naumovozyma castellii CBS 4309]CCC68974.1 hypothetical protein NCAS_0B08900 [Naumovozyma castellii CBS 4309]